MLLEGELEAEADVTEMVETKEEMKAVQQVTVKGAFDVEMSLAG